MYYILSVSSWTRVLANEAGRVTIPFKCIYNLLLHFHSLYTWRWQCVGSGHDGPHYSYLSIYIHRQEVEVRRPRTTVTLPYIHGLSEALRRIFTQLDIKVVFRPLSATYWYTPKTQYHWTNRRGLCTPYLITNAPRYTLDKLAEPLDIDWQSIDRLRRMVM